jgi:hypothetical protein
MMPIAYPYQQKPGPGEWNRLITYSRWRNRPPVVPMEIG